MKAKNLVLVALFAALTAVAGLFLKFPAPIVQFSFQFLFVVMAGLLLGSKLGALSQIVYVALGLAGLPIFTNGGGPGYIFQPSFGYLVGFVGGAFVTGLIAERAKRLSWIRALAASLAGLIVVYLIGVSYLYFNLNLYQHKPTSLGNALYIGVVIFLLYDVLKCIVAAYLAAKIRPIVINAGHRSTKNDK